MNWIEKVVKIKEDLAKAGYNDLVNEILNAQMMLGTPGEMYLEVMNVLVKIKNDKKPEWEIIKEDVEDLLKYVRDIGYFII